MQDVFHFKNFSVSQRRSAMKVGTDGVLLGAWAKGGSRILDIGAGTGVISLMMAQRFPQSSVTGVEIDHDAAQEATDNVRASSFSGRITIEETALQHFSPKSKFDVIVTNPPFFSNGFKVENEARRLARQTDSLSFADIMDFSKKWLDEDGELSLVLPVDAFEPFSVEASFRGFFLSRRYYVKTVARKKAKRCLVAFTLHRPAAFDAREVTLLEQDGSKSEWYNDLTADFYL